MSFLTDEDLIEEFLAESREHLELIDPDLLCLERDGNAISPEIINRIFRAIHSIKGAAGFFGFENLKNLAHIMESALMQVRDGKLGVTSDLMNAFFGGVDLLRAMVENIHASNEMSIELQVEPFHKILDARGTNQQLEMRGAKDAKNFHLDAESVANALREGMEIYHLQVNLHRDIQQKWSSPMAFLNKIMAIGGLS